jgi:hypothetical protein
VLVLVLVQIQMQIQVQVQVLVPIQVQVQVLVQIQMQQVQQVLHLPLQRQEWRVLVTAWLGGAPHPQAWGHLPAWGRRWAGEAPQGPQTPDPPRQRRMTGRARGRGTMAHRAGG